MSAYIDVLHGLDVLFNLHCLLCAITVGTSLWRGYVRCLMGSLPGK